MKPEFLHPDIFAFVLEHENADVPLLSLRHKTVSGVPFPFIADQISGRRKAKEKLPTYYKNRHIIYPPALSLEQSSSEQTASFKQTTIADELSKFELNAVVAADLTGGFGVDSFYLSKLCQEFYYVDPQPELLDIARYNHQQLGTGNIQYHQSTAEEFLASTTVRFDFVFIDPSRRDSGKKVFALKDCFPDVTTFQEKIIPRTKILLIKAAPLLDIHVALKELAFVKKVFVLSVENECKELLFLCAPGFGNEPEIIAVNIAGGTPAKFEFKFSEEKITEVSVGEPQSYLYEPNASILKAGAFKSVAHRFGLSKIHISTHLYTTESLRSDFPGRIFRILGFVKPDPKHVREFFPELKANVTTRNYPLGVEELKKKTGLKDGGDKFLIGFSGLNKKYLVAAERIK